MRGWMTCLLVTVEALVVVVVAVEGAETVPSRLDTVANPEEEGFSLMVPVSLLMQDAPEDPSLPLTTPAPVKRAGRRFRTASSSMNEYQMCRPSRREMLALLLALHEVRQGRNTGTLVRLCNTHTRPASLDTNIRFMG
ncbi:uncharacterized protein LOC123510319 [Portunus trituberculatus]|uniref:uncharacterized protein LOC123510319 n=1 Tax=Portunus trituberculatus TaxID=210409 RepID=UPI001E1D06DA|nr:uncharacterized protein LOC123510319 [Portunus trituberculatus]